MSFGTTARSPLDVTVIKEDQSPMLYNFCDLLHALISYGRQGCGLYYKSFMIVIYNCNDSAIVIYDRNDSGLYNKTKIVAR